MGESRLTPLLAIPVAIIMAAPAYAAGETITYEVVSDAPLLSVNYFNSMNDMTSQQDLPSSWSTSFTGQATYQLMSISAQTTGVQVACRLTVNGVVRDQKTATGRYSVVICSSAG